MFGFPLVLLGVSLVVVAYLLLRFQGRLRQITGAIDRGFLTMESGINSNLPKFKDVMAGVDNSFKAIEDGVTQNILAPGGVLPDVTNALNGASGLFHSAAQYIDQGKFIVVNDPNNPKAESAESVLGEAMKITTHLQKMLGDAGGFLNDIGNFLDNTSIIVPSPLGPLPAPPLGGGKTFRDVGNLANSASADCTKALSEEMILLAKLTMVSYQLDQLETTANNMGDEIQGLNQQVGTTFQAGITTSRDELEKMRMSIDGMLLTFQNGVQASVTELDKARIFLDTQIQGLVSSQLIRGLAILGAILIIIGVGIGP